MVHAQEGTTSIYSYYGIGLQKFKGTVANRSMGGLQIHNDATHLNLQNPASYAGLQLTTLEAGVGRSQLYATNGNATEKTATSTIDYLAVGIPAGKLGFGFGLVPITSVGYSLESNSDTENSLFSGFGGLNRVYLSMAYEAFKGFYIGVEGQYNFGAIENKQITSGTQEIGVPFGTRDLQRSELLGFSYSFGLAFKRQLKQQTYLQSGFSFSPASKLISENYREIAPFSGISPTGVEIVNGNDIQKLTVADRNLTIPSQFSIGVGVGELNKWFVGGEIGSKQSSDFTNRSFDQSNVSFRSAFSSKIGGYYIPKYNSLTSYWNRISYRSGIRYQETGLLINNEPINEFGISFGVGLPVSRLRSNIDLGLELGQRGTNKEGLIKETFLNFQVGLSLNDRWFIKRKYD